MAQVEVRVAKRIISAVVALPLVVWVIYQGGWWFAAAVVAVSVVCLLEFNAMFAFEDRAYRGLVVLSGVTVVLCSFTGALASDAAVALLGMIAVILLGYLLFRPRNVETVATRAGLGMLAVAWAGGLLAATGAVRLLPDGHTWFYLACILAWGSDTGAYFAGRLFGRRKLYEKVSPNKTWEGAVGGVVTATAGAVLFKELLGAPNVPLTHLIVLSSLAAVVGQLGDLAESLLKRSVGVKDSGRIMPGHGGLLDRVDALVFIGPLLLLYGTLFLDGSVSWLSLTP